MDPKQLLLAHFEKLVLAVFAGWLLLALVSFAAPPEELTKNEQLTADMEKIDGYMKNTQPDLPAPPSLVQELRAQLAPEEVRSGDPFAPWVFHRRPQLLYRVEGPPPTHSAVHKAPVDVILDTDERGKVKVKWSPSTENAYIIVAKYEVERRTGEEGEWQVVGGVDGQETEYVDADVQSRAKYYYRVVSLAEIDRDNPVVDAENMTLKEADERRTSSLAGPAETARDVYIVPVTVQQVTRDDLIANPNATESAYLKVFKWDTETGKFESKTFTVKVGEKVGGEVKRGRKTVDFSTGATLKDVEIRQRRNEKLGYDEPVQWILVEYPDGSTEEATDKDVPEELKRD